MTLNCSEKVGNLLKRVEKSEFPSALWHSVSGYRDSHSPNFPHLHNISPSSSMTIKSKEKHRNAF